MVPLISCSTADPPRDGAVPDKNELGKLTFPLRKLLCSHDVDLQPHRCFIED